MPFSSSLESDNITIIALSSLTAGQIAGTIAGYNNMTGEMGEAGDG